MRLRATQLILSALLLCSFGVPHNYGQEQGPESQQQDPEHKQNSNPSKNPEAPGTTEPTVPSGQNAPAEQKATPPPKPPVLRHRKPKRNAKKPATPSADSTKSQGAPKKIVVRNGGEKDQSAQLAPAMNPDQARRQRAATERLLAQTNARLKQISGRELSESEQSTVQEIRIYLRQAKAASDAGDTNRAQTLAYKASLLSNELAPK